MKWIGQHIWDFISRFRNDVYLEDVSTGTIASGGNLGLDSANKIVKATVSGGGGAVNDLTDANTSGVAANDILVWNGSSFVVESMTDLIATPAFFTFAWDQVAYNMNGGATADDVTDTSPASDSTSNELCGSGNHITSIDITHALSNSVSGDFTSGATGSDNLGLQTKAVGAGSYTSHQNLTYNSGNPTASHTINLPFPTDLNSNQYNYIKTKFTYDGTAYDHILKYFYRNYMYLGKHTDVTPTTAELRGFEHDEYIDNGSTSNDVMGAEAVSLNSTPQYLQFWYPSRISGSTPSFQTGSSSGALNPETWVALGTLSHTNESGFVETYQGYRSPEQLDDSSEGIDSWFVKVTMS